MIIIVLCSALKSNSSYTAHHTKYEVENVSIKRMGLQQLENVSIKRMGLQCLENAYIKGMGLQLLDTVSIKGWIFSS